MNIDKIEGTQTHKHANEDKSKSWPMPMMNFHISTNNSTTIVFHGSTSVLLFFSESKTSVRHCTQLGGKEHGLGYYFEA